MRARFFLKGGGFEKQPRHPRREEIRGRISEKRKSERSESNILHAVIPLGICQMLCMWKTRAERQVKNTY